MIHSDFMQLAVRAVKVVSEISINKFNELKELSYKSGDEVVTDVDIACEKKIKEIIASLYPDHQFLGEEEGFVQTKSKYTWILDPIDGTVNYSRGIRLYGISLALAEDDRVVLGVVCNPISREIFTAEKGKGAFLNDQKIHVSDISDSSKEVVYATELYKSLDYVTEIAKEVKQFRITSSSAYETCLVAAGKIEAFIKITSHPWGFAAANLIVEEAGGKVTNFDGTKWDIHSTKLLSSNGLVHSDLLKRLNHGSETI